ncbi:MAG: 3-deoxy-D-manno-octulosonic acid transferase [Candidatus Omnitrophota bacterium]|nr:3-deoxy-D-manno-octulosonic acid transferase [Candidatus Omnitrophota bacterium]
MSIIYDLIYLVLAIFYLPYFFYRLLRDRRYAGGFLMRFGRLPKKKQELLSGRKVIWLHAVSVGEIISAQALIRALRNEFPGYSLVVSTVTSTGNQVARKMASPQDVVIYLPFDLSWIVKAVVDKINPVLFLILETEIWPNLINCLFKKEVPVALVNGRISASSFKGYQKARFLLRGILSKISLFCMQTKLGAERIISLGAPAERVKVSGNMKFDQPGLGQFSIEKIEQLRALLDLQNGSELFVAGSTHNGEEKALLDVYRNLNRRFPGLKLLIAPRHPERTSQIERLVSKYGFKPIRISQLLTHNAQRTTHNSPVFILDTIGQLRMLYALATVVFVGGSLLRRGGQNLIEPAVLGKPVISGPHFFNFQDVGDMLISKNGAIVVKDKPELEKAVVELLDEPSKRLLLGQRAKEVVEANLGATDRCIELIKIKALNPK